MIEKIKYIINNYNSCVWNYKFCLPLREIYDELLHKTSFLNKNNKVNERFYCILNNITKIPKCYCGKNLKYTKALNGYREFCSTKCLNSSSKIQEKKKKTFFKKYGVENPAQIKEVKEKIKQTNLKRYGFDHPSKRPEYKQISKNIQNKNYYLNKISNFKHVTPEFSINEYNGIDNRRQYKWKCEKCNNIFESHLHSRIPRCLKCYPHKISKIENDIIFYLKDYVKCSKKRFSINNKIYELDVYIPSHNLGIEFNGLYWHSEFVGMGRDYHINKTNWFKENFNISVIHIFENEWILKQDIVKSIILNRLGLIENRIYARKCEFKEIDSKTYKEFLELNHIQGSCNSKYKFGLFHNNELVSVIGFGKSRFEKNKLELHRFCNKINTSVIGGFSKLLKRSGFKGTTFCDLRYFNAHGYKKIGFKELGRSRPNYWYFNKPQGDLHNRIQFQKHKLKDKLEKFDLQLTEWENMQMNGWNRIWDCGNMKLEF